MSTKPLAPVTKEVKLTVSENESAVVVHVEIERMITSAYELQEDIENPSKFTRAFLFDAVNAQLKAHCNRIIGDWDRLVDKAQKLHPQQTREQVAQELLVSKRAKSLADYAVKAAAVKAKL